MAADSYDAIVVGGGHNGLVAAAYLARTGAKTLVLEARGTTGGAATTEAPWPDAPEFRVTRLSYVMSLLPATIMNDLQLERHGYKIFPMGPYYQAFPEGGSLTLYEEDSQRAYDEIARWSKSDADAYPKWNAWLGGLADVLERRIAEMGGLAEKMVIEAVDALASGDSTLAHRVVETDPRLDALQREIEEQATLTIARRQPVANDLREIIGAIRVAGDLERVGDLAKNIARRSVKIGMEGRVPRAIIGIKHMTNSRPS